MMASQFTQSALFVVSGFVVGFFTGEMHSQWLKAENIELRAKLDAFRRAEMQKPVVAGADFDPKIPRIQLRDPVPEW